ncbi:MAG TPA: 50S ribosomal protein L25/general stress protein Ctc [Candidatus Competibacteraceae bacterium]|nr:50S ribosomal protein L25/general stress protein Ctc [Candidatus Competibacteraceae bacterium]
MSISFEVIAETRADVGKGASRRLRREGKVPAILYGAGQEAVNLVVEQNAIAKQLENEAFYSHILTIKVGERTEQAILRDLQRHPWKPLILHMDFQRVSEADKIKVRVPLHFINEDSSKGVKLQGGVVSHLLTEVEVSCLPRNLPEYIEVDLAEMELGQTLHLSELKLPAGVEIPALAQGPEYDVAVVNIHHGRVGAEEESGAAQ